MVALVTLELNDSWPEIMNYQIESGEVWCSIYK